MKNHMTVLCGDEKDSALPTHTPTRASNALSLRKTVIGGMLVALTVALSGFPYRSAPPAAFQSSISSTLSPEFFLGRYMASPWLSAPL